MEFKNRSDIKCPNCEAELDEYNEHTLISGGVFETDRLFNFKCHKCGKNIQIEFIPSFYVGRIMDGGQASDHFTLEQLKKIEELNSSMVRILRQDHPRILNGQARYYEALDELRQAKYDRIKHYAESSRSLDYGSKWLEKAKEIEIVIESLEKDLERILADPETKKNVDSIEKMFEEKNRIRLSIKPVCKP